MKIMKTLLAGFSAAALLFAASCTNQLDYLNATTNRTAVKIGGFKVTGLDKSLNGAKAQLMDKDGELISAIVADHYEKDDVVVGYAAGTAYAKLETPILIDTDETCSSKIEVYLKVGNKEYKVAKADGTGVENASLAIPSSFPGTTDENLPVKYIDVTVNGDVAGFAWADKIDEPVNITVYQVELDVLNATADTLPAGVTVKATEKAGTNCKYTLTLTGLQENAGTELVLGGADISTTDGDLGGHWYDSSKYKQKIDKDGKVSWTFYGGPVNGGNIAGWGRTYSQDVAGPEILICLADEEKKEAGVRLLASGVSRNGKEDDSENFMFPGYTAGKDVEMVIDVSKLPDANKEKADPISPVMSFNVDGIKVINAPTPEDGEKAYIVNGDDDPERIMWVPEAGKWDRTAHSYTKAEINAKGNYAWRFDEPVAITPNAETFKLGARICTPKVDGNFWDNQHGQFYSAHYNTEEFKDGSYTLIIDLKAKKQYLIPTTSVDYEFKVTFTKVIAETNFGGESVELIGDFNGWGDAGTIAGTPNGDSTVFDLTGITICDNFKVRSAGTWNGPVIAGGPGGNIKLPAATKSGNFAIVLGDFANGNFGKISAKAVE